MANFVFLHGGGQGSWVWDELIQTLRAKGTECLALDVPGCGAKRGREVSTLTVDNIARELLLDIEAVRFEKPVLVGHSLAGALLPRMAEFAPDCFSGLIFLACTIPVPGVSFIQQIGNGVQGENEDEVGWPVDPATHSATERYRAMFCNDMDAESAEMFLAQLGADHWPMDPLTATDWRYDHLAAQSVTYVLCERDQALPAAWQERFAVRLPGARMVRLDAGHQAMNTQPQELAELLLAEARQ